MATVKYSRQREAIKNFLMSRKDHPTAEVVYEHVLKAFPNISLGTVYRNLFWLITVRQSKFLVKTALSTLTEMSCRIIIFNVQNVVQ
mgnify:CR=1 FL=1